MEVNLVKKEKEQSKNPPNISYLKDLSQNSYSQDLLDNVFTVFKSIIFLIDLIPLYCETIIIFFIIIDNLK